MKKTELTLLCVFCVLLFGGALASAICPDREYSVIENRELAQKPTFTKKQFLKGKYQKKQEAYLSDQFPLRDRWVDLSAMLQAAIGKRDINDVYIGKGGYLLERYGESDFDTEQIEENINTLSSFLNDMWKVYGERHVSCMMIPMKALALSDRLPAFAPVPERNKIMTALKSRLSYPHMCLDLHTTLQEHQKEYIYYRTDHHWTTLGAYYAYQAWAEHTAQATPYPLGHYERETVFTDFYGTTYNKAHVKVPADSVELFHHPGEDNVHVSMDDGETEADTVYFPQEAKQGFNRYNVFFSKNTFQVEVTTEAKTGKELLLVKDSFANCFVPFLLEDYDRIIMLDYRYGKTPVGKILGENEDITDILVLFNTEKFMQNTKLGKLADTEKRGQTLEEFHMEDFLE